MTTIRVVKLRDYILNEDTKEILFERNGKKFYGALFMRPDVGTRICKTYKTIEINEDDEKTEVLKAIKAYIELREEFNLTVYKSTFKTMLHWAYMNGFSNYLFSTYNKSEVFKWATFIGRPDMAD